MGFGTSGFGQGMMQGQQLISNMIDPALGVIDQRRAGALELQRLKERALMEQQMKMQEAEQNQKASQAALKALFGGDVANPESMAAANAIPQPVKGAISQNPGEQAIQDSTVPPQVQAALPQAQAFNENAYALKLAPGYTKGGLTDVPALMKAVQDAKEKHEEKQYLIANKMGDLPLSFAKSGYGADLRKQNAESSPQAIAMKQATIANFKKAGFDPGIPEEMLGEIPYAQLMQMGTSNIGALKSQQAMDSAELSQRRMEMSMTKLGQSIAKGNSSGSGKSKADKGVPVVIDGVRVGKKYADGSYDSVETKMMADKASGKGKDPGKKPAINYVFSPVIKAK